MKEKTPNKNLASVCGLFCVSCGLYYATQENNRPRLDAIAKHLGLQPNETYCDGCRSERKTSNCKNCSLIKCAEGKGVDFCAECSDYPCSELKNFQEKMPHRKEIWNSQERIKNVGWEQWYEEMVDFYSCTACDTINGAYDIQCRNCGNTPSNEFVKLHMNYSR